MATRCGNGQLLTYVEASALIGIRPNTLRTWVLGGQMGIPVLKFGQRVVRFDRTRLIEWIASKQQGGSSESEGAR